jgi:hypothetical protein
MSPDGLVATHAKVEPCPSLHETKSSTDASVEQMAVCHRFYIYSKTSVKVSNRQVFKLIDSVSRSIPTIGDYCELRAWLGYNGKSRRIYFGVVTDVQFIIITESAIAVSISGTIDDIVILQQIGAEAFAVLCGFESPSDLINYHADVYGLPFKGFVMTWRERS